MKLRKTLILTEKTKSENDFVKWERIVKKFMTASGYFHERVNERRTKYNVFLVSVFRFSSPLMHDS